MSCPRGHHYPRRGEIPRFAAESSYADPFAVQWKRYRETQLDSHTGVAITARRLRRCLGEDLWASLPGLCVLECGCGAGRFTEILLQQGASVTSVDLSAAVEANQHNFPQGSQHRIAQADLRALPFIDRAFDVVLCLGVVQHTPDPEQTLAALYQQVMPGGWLVVDHYRLGPSYFLSTLPLARQAFLRLPPKKSLQRSEQLVRALLPVHRRIGRTRLRYALLTRVSPVRSYYHSYPQLPEAHQREWALLDTHDALTDRFKHTRGEAAVARSLKAMGLQNIWVIRGGNGVEARGQRPRHN